MCDILGTPVASMPQHDVRWRLIVARGKVSQIDNLAHYTKRKQADELDRKNPYYLSTLTNHKNTERGVVTGDFERKQYSEWVEQAFD
jgi:hypothetical protein